MGKTKRSILSIGLILIPTLTFAMNIGYFDSSRESWGFSAGGPYCSNAKAWLEDQGHTLVSTNNVTDEFLGGVDAFYTGLLNNVYTSEIEAMQNFVDVQGGFLFIQTDWADAPWTAPANQILNNWDIQVGGSYVNDLGHYTVGTSDWVTDPNDVDGLIGSAHSVITSSPTDFQVLAYDDLDRAVLGVFDAGAGRSSDVLISTDINMFDDAYGWNDARNRALWENIWTTAENQVESVPEPSSLFLIVFGVGSLFFARKRRS